MTQPTLFDISPVKSIKRKPAPAPAPQPATETIHQTLARYAREAAENRAQLRREGKI